MPEERIPPMSSTPRYPAAYDERSREVLETAIRRIAAYRPWRNLDPGPEHDINIRYAALPVLTKKDIRRNFSKGHMMTDRDVDRGLASGEIALVQTSGTTDQRVTNIWNQTWWDASERASWKLNSHTRKAATGNHPEAILSNPLNVGFSSDSAELPLEKRKLARFLYLNEKTNPSSWTAEHMDRMARELEIFRPAILEANPSLLAKLCRYLNGRKIRAYQPELIVFTYEYPAYFHLRQIRKIFNVPLVSSYGTTETGYVFMQCEAGKFHQNSEFCRVDFQPLKPEHGGPRLGRILVTTFNNPWYYVIRFDVGDLVRLDEEGKCPCGRDAGMILKNIEGRAANVTFTVDGRLVSLHELDEALSVLEEIDEYRLEQVAKQAYLLYLASPQREKARLMDKATGILKNLYGLKAEISVIDEAHITPEKSGKYSLAKTDFPVKIERYLDESHHTQKRQRIE